ncbi:MAG TPA: HlyD family efflux transporter periplasmic adaptor subunit [Tepidisphaeraceae bacterium]|nr:HlyD family efflux transporter periplasmic adaptor subunit [Tepidisphaeraceae bacterium]
MSSGIVESSQSGSEQQPQKDQPISRTRLVARLLAASANLPNFVNDLILTQAQLVVGTEAAAFLVEPPHEQGGESTLKAVAHIRPDQSDADTRAAALNAFQQIIKPCIEQNKDGAIQIDDTHDGTDWQYCLVTLLRSEGNIVGATAVVARARDNERAQQRLTSMQLVAGYFELFMLRRTSEQSRSIAQSHQHVLQLATAVATADGFESAAMNLCNELSARTHAARVSLGWVKNETIKLKALSHTEEFDKKQEMSVQLVKVMEECLDNDEIVQYEPDGTTTNTVTREAQALSRTQNGESILSLPLRRKGEVVGVVTLEFAPNTKIGAQAATGLAVAVELLAPQLYDRFQNDRWLITKVGLSIEDAGKKAIGPKYMLAKTIIVSIILVLGFITFFKPMYHIQAPFQFTPIEKRTFSSPYDGMLKDVYARPGDIVKAGQVLAEFDTSDLLQERIKSLSDAHRAEQEAIKYRADPTKTAEALMSEQERISAQAQADMYELQINRAKIVAPFDGEVLTGDLRDKRGAVFKQGEPVMEMAQRKSMWAEINVSERDIQDIKVGTKGKLATTAMPNESKSITIERIVPQGVAKEQSNTFTVFAKLDDPSDQWRPGMQGEVRIDVGPRRLIWIWTHRFIDFVRLKLWM